MRRMIDRKYILTSEEIKEAVWAWLKSRDIPVPADAKGLYVSSDDMLPSDVTFFYSDDGHL